MKRIWIEDGCIACRACEYECPEIFDVGSGGSRIRACGRADGQAGVNRDARSELPAEAAIAYAERIEQAVSGCPVGVIRVD